MFDTPGPIRTMQLNNIGPGQYLDGRPLEYSGAASIGSDIDAASELCQIQATLLGVIGYARTVPGWRSLMDKSKIPVWRKNQLASWQGWHLRILDHVSKGLTAKTWLYNQAKDPPRPLKSWWRQPRERFWSPGKEIPRNRSCSPTTILASTTCPTFR